MNKKRSEFDFSGESNSNAISFAIINLLAEVSPDEWKYITVSNWTYPMVPDGDSIQVFYYRGDDIDLMLYRIPGTDSFKIDFYKRIQFEHFRKAMVKPLKGKAAQKLALEKALNEDLKECDMLPSECPVFFSLDLLDVLKSIKGMRSHPNRPSEDIDYNIIAAAPIYKYKKRTFIAISKIMMDKDYTPNDMYVLVPLLSLKAFRQMENGNPNEIHELLRDLYAETIIANAENWEEEASKQGMCGHVDSEHAKDGTWTDLEDVKRELEKWLNDDEASDKVENAPMDTTPVKLGDEGNWGVQQNGDILFTSQQISGIDQELKFVLKYTPPIEWSLISPNKTAFHELVGLDYSVGCQSGKTTYAISLMSDPDDGDFFVFSTFVDGKKTEGKIFRKSDFANYMLCNCRMFAVLRMLKFLVMFGETEEPPKPKKRTASRSAKSGKKKKQ